MSYFRRARPRAVIEDLLSGSDVQLALPHPPQIPFFCVTIYSSSCAMPQTTSDGSSTISESLRFSINSRDGDLCVLCGMDPVDVGHIIARKSGDQRLVSEISRLVQTVEIHEQIGRLIGFAG